MIDIDVSKIVSEIGESKARLIENEDQRRQRMQVFVFCSAFLFILVLGTITFFALDRTVLASTQTLMSDVNKIKEENKQYIEFEKEARAIQTRNRDALSVILEMPMWSYVFDQIEKVIPQGVTLTRFEVDSSDQMRISGTATDYSNLSKLVVSMNDLKVSAGDGKQESVFSNVNVKSASLAKIKEKVLIDFSVSFSFVKKINRGSIDNPIEESNTQNKQNTDQKNTNEEKPAPSPSLPKIEDYSGETEVPKETETSPTPAPAAPDNPSVPETPEPSEGGLLPVL